MSNTIKVINESSPEAVEVKHSSTEEVERRRAARKVIARKVLDAQFVQRSLDGMTSANNQATAVETHEQEVSPEAVGAPSGFPETAELEAERDEVGPVATSLRSRLMYQLGRPATFIYSKMFDMAEKRSFKLQSMSDEEKEAHINKVGRRSTIATLGVGALYGAYMFATKSNMLDFTASSGGSDNLDTAREAHAQEFGGVKNASVTMDVSTEGNAPDVDKPVFGTRTFEAADFTYNPLEDPALSPAKKGNDFGPALQALPNDEAMDWPGGMSDLLNDRWTNSPEEFATAMSKFGLVENNADAINTLAEQMKANPELFHENYDKVMEMLSRADISEKAITQPYGSYYVVNMGGRDVLVAYDGNVDHGGTAIVVKVDGKEIWIRKECGGQLIDLKPRVIQQAQAQTYQSQQGYRPQGGGQVYDQVPSRPGTPGEQPNNPGDLPDTDLPGTDLPDIPGGENPVEGEHKDYSGGVDTAEGIDPSQNGFVEWTPDPAEHGNGTAAPDLVPGALPGAEVSQPAPGAGTNIFDQIFTPEAGAGTNRTAQDAADVGQSIRDSQQQQAANNSAADMDNTMSGGNAISDAIKKAQEGIGADGRPN